MNAKSIVDAYKSTKLTNKLNKGKITYLLMKGLFAIFQANNRVRDG